MYLQLLDAVTISALPDSVLVLGEASFTMSDGYVGRSFDDTTTIHPIGLSILAISCIYILLAKLERVVLPFIVMMCFIGSAQRIVILGVDFDFARILIIFGIIRILLGQEWKIWAVNSADCAIITWSLGKFFAFNILWMELPKLQWSLGHLLDSLGVYLVFRMTLNTREDVIYFVKLMAWVSLPIAIFFIYESITRINIFSVFGGVPAVTVEREGRLRCQGPYVHPVVAGCFWAATAPITAYLFTRQQVLPLASLLASLIIVFTCSSSTPVFGVIMASIGLVLWYAKFLVRPILLTIAVLLPILHVAMKAPVWSLISRVSAVSGSTSWHRFNLIDQTINRFSEWVLVGTKSTHHWGHFLADTANQYVAQAVSGGITSLISFIMVLVIGFRFCGRYPSGDGDARLLSWCLGVALLVHCANFIGLAYFGEISTLLFIHLACIASIPSWGGSIDWRELDE